MRNKNDTYAEQYQKELEEQESYELIDVPTQVQNFRALIEEMNPRGKFMSNTTRDRNVSLARALIDDQVSMIKTNAEYKRALATVNLGHFGDLSRDELAQSYKLENLETSHEYDIDLENIKHENQLTRMSSDYGYNVNLENLKHTNSVALAGTNLSNNLTLEEVKYQYNSDLAFENANYSRQLAEIKAKLDAGLEEVRAAYQADLNLKYNLEKGGVDLINGLIKTFIPGLVRSK